MSGIKHSVKVPRLYKDASRILKAVHEGGSLKDLVFNHSRFANIKALHALVAESLRYDNILSRILNCTNILELESRLDPWLAKILVTELLFGKKRLPGDSKPILTVLKFENDLLRELNRADVLNISLYKRHRKASKPKYVRINILKIAFEDAIEKFKGEGWEELTCPDNYEDYLKLIKQRLFNEEYVFVKDYHVKNLLVFPSGVHFYDHPAYLERFIILQDKGSCLLTCCVPIKCGSAVLDMCAAPGMKTSLMAACLNNKGKIYAIEQDVRRFETMKKLLAEFGVDCVEFGNCDAGSIGPNSCKDVKYILVDPSCSGTGMTSRIEDAEMTRKTINNKWRLQKLANLQGYLLRHAISNFPSAKYVFYSTCSLQVEENENVVESVLGCAKLHGYSLINVKKKIKGWKSFGSTDYECGEKCIYSRPERDFTNGGFLAVFKRKSKADLSLFETKEEKMNEGNTVEVKKIKLSEQFFALVNTLKISLEDAIQFFVDNGWKHLPSPMNYNIFLSSLEEDSERVKEKFFEQDFHVKELLLFPRGVVDELSKKFIDQHKFILLDKASCLAVHLLDPSPGSVVLDMSAGNEKMTLHIAARMNNSGTVYAYESDYHLHKELSMEIKMCGMSCVQMKYDSGFYSNSNDCPGVQLILVAPPCSESGSGIAEKTQYSLIKNVDTKNKGLILRKYIVTQFSLLRRALTEFPEAFRVVYSTHSINREENEDIINALLVLANFNGFKLIDAPSRVDGWKNESDNKYHFASKCLITCDKMSITKGFFIAVFERDFKVYSDKISLNGSDINVDSSLNTVDCFKINKRNKKEKFFRENYKHTPDEEEISDGNAHFKELSKSATINDDSLHLNRSIYSDDDYEYNCEEINYERIAKEPKIKTEYKEKTVEIISMLQKKKKISEVYDYNVASDVHECKRSKKQKFDSKDLTEKHELVRSKKLKSQKKKTSPESDEVALSKINEYKKRTKEKSIRENDKHTADEEIFDGNAGFTEISKLATINDESLHLNRSIYSDDNYEYNCKEINDERIAKEPKTKTEDKEKTAEIISKLKKKKKISEGYDFNVASDFRECKRSKKQKFDSKDLTEKHELVSSKKLKSQKKKTSPESDEVTLSEINEYKKRKKKKSVRENDKQTADEEIFDGNAGFTEISKLVKINDESLHLNRSTYSDDDYEYNCDEINYEKIAKEPETKTEDKEKTAEIISKLQKKKKISEGYDYNMASDVHERKKSKKQKFDSKDLTEEHELNSSSKKLKSQKKKTSQESDEVTLSEINEYKKRNKRWKRDNEILIKKKNVFG